MARQTIQQSAMIGIFRPTISHKNAHVTVGSMLPRRQYFATPCPMTLAARFRLRCEHFVLTRKETAMGKIAVHEFISLDGVYEDPSWTFDFGFDPKMGETIGAITQASDAILLGRRTYEMFYPAWSTRTADEDPGAPFFNETAKYVVSGTLEDAPWSNSTILGAYNPDRIRELKEQADGIYVSGSGTLVRGMLADGLVDELHLFVFPIALGSGDRLFRESGSPTKLELADTDRYDNGVVHLAYRPAS
jgi:dihydrofolate reductase